MRPIGSLQIGRHCVGSAASFAYLADHTVGFIGATTVMHQDLRTGGGECQRAGAADAAGGAGDESGFSGEVGHDCSLSCLKGMDTYGAQGTAADRNAETSRTNSSGY